MRRLLSERNFRLLLVGQTLTMFGDVALFLVLAIWVKELTGSDGAAGSVFLAFAIPALLAPLGAVFVDRFPRRRVMIVNDLATAGVVLALLFVRDRGDVWLIYAVAALYGVSQQIFFAARSGLLVSMLDDERLGEANALLESLRQGLRVAGPLLGAGLYAVVGGGVVATIDAATFVASAVFLWLLRVPDLERRDARPRLAAELAAGAKHILATLELRRVVGVLTLALTTVGMLEVAIFALVDQGLGRPPAFVGVVGSIQGGGSILGGLVASRLMRGLGEVRTVGAGLAVVGMGLGVLVFPTLPAIAVGVVLVGAALSVLLVGYMTLLQRRTTLELQGRVFAAAEAALGIPYAASMALAAALITVVDYRLIYALNGALLLFLGLFLARPPAPHRDLTPSVSEA